MAGNGYYIGIDIGTTHIKTAVFTDDGRMTELFREHTPETPDAYGTVYLPEEFWRIVSEQLKKAAAAIPGGPGTWGIAVTGMAEAGLVIDRKTGKELTPILPWFDKRTAQLADEITPEEAEDGFYYMYATSAEDGYFCWKSANLADWSDPVKVLPGLRTGRNCL